MSGEVCGLEWDNDDGNYSCELPDDHSDADLVGYGSHQCHCGALL